MDYRRRAGAVGVMLLLMCSAGAFGAGGAEDWAKARGFSVDKIVTTNLESGLGRGWRALPFTLTADEEADAKATVALANLWREKTNGHPAFEKASTRDALQTILKKQPHAFYVEFLLGQWETLYGGRTGGDTPDDGCLCGRSGDCGAAL